ncbi:MAG: hypothetical protein IPP32_12355 [Bacteroidetes bacterium]|nr:hypothetical protein [Bacteroidota bacterium]
MTLEEELIFSINILQKLRDHLKQNSNNKELIERTLQKLRDKKLDLILTEFISGEEEII